jgi:Uma2 family endonuclease
MSTAVATQARRYTPEDLLAMPDGKSYELVDGRLVERSMGAESSEVGGNLYSRLHLFCREHDPGKRPITASSASATPPAWSSGPTSPSSRGADWPGDISPRGWVRIPPDLAIEVISPNDSIEEFEEKLEDYQKAGVPLAWVINPKRRKVRVFRLDGSDVVLMEDDVLSGEDVIPGFRCPLREILPRRSAAEGPPATPAGPNGTGPA